MKTGVSHLMTSCRRFWQVRDPFPETAKNEFLERWESNVAIARERFPDLSDRRAAFLMLHGAPASTFRSSCEMLRPLEIWLYRQSTVLRHQFAEPAPIRGGPCPRTGRGAVRGAAGELESLEAAISEGQEHRAVEHDDGRHPRQPWGGPPQ